MRPSSRKFDELREIKFERNYTRHAEGSVLASYGDTKVLCNVSIIPGVPRFLKNKNQGWLTAEYGMLPRSTHDRCDREAVRGKQSGRSQEVQRIIGRSLRAMLDLTKLGENTITIDCDVLQADGSTRTASISGACIAIHDAIQTMLQKKIIKYNPIKFLIAAVSVGIYKDTVITDLDYLEDSNADADLNLIIDQNGNIIEIQGTAEADPFSYSQLQKMIDMGHASGKSIIELQRSILGI